MTATLTAATVKYQSKQVTTKHGDRINAVVTLPGGEEVTLWGRVDDQSLLTLRKGQSVQLVKDSKGFKLLAPTDEPATSPAKTGQMTPEQKRLVAAYVQEQAKLFRYCWDTAAQQMDGIETLTNEDLRAIATTLHIAAQRKFNF